MKKRDIIVRREFSFDSAGKFSHGRKRGATIVSLNFFRPTRPTGGVHKCVYEIRMNNRVVRRFAVHGFDGVSALGFAMGYAVIDLETGFLERWRVSIPAEYFDDMRGK